MLYSQSKVFAGNLISPTKYIRKLKLEQLSKNRKTL